MFLRPAKTISRTFQALSYSSNASNNKVAVILSGSGVYDGSEIHEASAAVVHLTRHKYEPVFFAPDATQMHVINHKKGEVASESRSVLVESARIARGNVAPITDLDAKDFKAIVFPGGFGVAKNLSNFAEKGPDCSVKPEVNKVFQDFQKNSKPIVLICIAPILAARLVPGVTLTLGSKDDSKEKWPHSDAIEAAKAMGAKIEHKQVSEYSFDAKNKILTTPAFMYNGQFYEIYDGIGNTIKALDGILKG